MKTAISLPDTLFEKAERLAANLGISRSQLYARAVESFIERHDVEAITTRLNEIYANEQSGVNPVLLSMQTDTLGDENRR
ncbi:MAG: hypothetical protein ISS57_02325 [Anaerolineales bacterium]|nr:hypothetical protein [Anaerolineales bacterium]